MNQLKRGVVFILLNSLLLLLAACSGLGADATQPEQAPILGSDVLFPPGSQASLICSDGCFDRGQCGGQTAGTRDVVLLSSFGPAVSGHDRWAAIDTTVPINSSQTRTVQKKQNGEQSPIEFYQVGLPNQGSAWVAGWCVQQQINVE